MSATSSATSSATTDSAATSTHIQEFLRNPKNNLLDLKKAPYHLKVKYHKQYNQLVMFHYHQILSDFAQEIVREARGIILDSTNNEWNIVSYPYKKFFNYGEKYAAIIKENEWSDSKVFAKLDGSLMVLYYYDHQWHVSSSGLPDASGNVNRQEKEKEKTFCDLFWKTFREDEKYQLPSSSSSSLTADEEACHFCFMFELMTPLNEVIVKHTRNQLLLHGARDLRTFQEYHPELIALKYGWRSVPSFSFDSFEKVLDAAKLLNPYEDEGFIIVGPSFQRIKIKNPQYVILAHRSGPALLKEKKTLSSIDFIKILQQNEQSEVIAYHPEHADLANRYESLVQEIEECWKRNSTTTAANNAKEFANAIKDLWYKGCLFQLRTRKITAAQKWLSKISPEEILEHLL